MFNFLLKLFTVFRAPTETKTCVHRAVQFLDVAVAIHSKFAAHSQLLLLMFYFAFLLYLRRVQRIKEEYGRNPAEKLLKELSSAQKLKQDLEKQLWKVNNCFLVFGLAIACHLPAVAPGH